MRKRILFPAALLLLVFSFVLSLCVGSAQISIREAVSALQNGSLTPDSRILFYVRLPRALAAVLSGAALAVSGVLLQNVLNNALAAPNIIGLIAEGEDVHFAGKQHGKEQTKQDGNPRRGEVFVRDAGKSADEKGAGIIDGIREKGLYGVAAGGENTA